MGRDGRRGVCLREQEDNRRRRGIHSRRCSGDAKPACDRLFRKFCPRGDRVRRRQRGLPPGQGRTRESHSVPMPALSVPHRPGSQKHCCSGSRFVPLGRNVRTTNLRHPSPPAALFGHVRVMVYPVLIVAKAQLSGRLPALVIFGKERNLPAAAGGVDHVLRHGIPGDVAAQSLDHF